MATQQNLPAGDPLKPVPRYARSPHDAASALGVEPAAGLSSARAGELLAAVGPNALSGEGPNRGGAVSSGSTPASGAGSGATRDHEKRIDD
ncbi:hypothetical protein [Streptomyces wuyuanensis]|uniref:hypothetical protein n=1 Tax=Streptomyces wuyuanensis TaxID=1196353 RepID=UPI003721CD34